MAIDDGDGEAQLLGDLIGLLRRYGAGWVVDEFEEGRRAADEQDPDAETRDPEQDVDDLLLAIARTVGLIPDLLIGSASLLTDVPDAPLGVVWGSTEVSFDRGELSNMAALVDHAAVLRAPIGDILRAEAADAEGAA